MAKFHVFLNGTNFWLKFGGKPGRFGFYTTRFIQADSAEQAELLAVELIREDEALRNNLLNDASDPPKITLERIEEVDSFGDHKPPGAGYAFYPEDPPH
jgi:hypothetical protein